ncbi:methyltransferase domain-containing protein [Actinoplanes sp. NPDC089786]|uniref:methyltransferase domain-containing protein n=1 Tax=Actinoplanes sp. NPDC089786 TaxID=3155185 RepID=UPI00342854B5
MAYLLDNQQSEAGERFGAINRMFNRRTFDRLDQVGIGAGWRVWEVGAGSSSVPAWLAGQVGPDGEVLATDLDTTWLDADAGFTTLRHDVAAEPPPGEGFDLVHSRMVLLHVPGRDQALASMIQALRPGGWLVLEDIDPLMQPLSCPDVYAPEHRRANRLREGFRTLLASRGADLAYGRPAPRRLREAGLTEIEAEGYFPLSMPDCAVLEAATIRQIRDDLIARDLATATEIDDHLAYVATDPGQFATSAIITAWGRKPL